MSDTKYIGEILRRHHLPDIAFDIRDALVASGIATPDQGKAFMDAWIDAGVERLDRELQAAYAAHEKETTPPTWPERLKQLFSHSST